MFSRIVKGRKHPFAALPGHWSLLLPRILRLMVIFFSAQLRLGSIRLNKKNRISTTKISPATDLEPNGLIFVHTKNRTHIINYSSCISAQKLN